MPAATAPAPARSTALTVIERVERSPAIQLLDSRASALLELLPDAAAANRFRRITIQAIAKNTDLLECSPESIVLSIFEAASQGLEPTGAAGGAHLVPYNVKVSKNPDRYEKRAQLIPDYRGVIQLVTKPRVDSKTGKVIALSEVLAIEARVVKEGDEFSWTEGSDAEVHHVPSLLAGRSAKPTTHVYALARFRSGGYSKPEVMDRAEVERIRAKGGRGGAAFSPWASDWDEMARKTVVKRLSKLLPVAPEIRSILIREDELSGDHDADPTVTVSTPAGARKVDRLAARLGGPAPAEAAAAEPAETDEVAGSFVEEAASAADVDTGDDFDLAEDLRRVAGESGLEGAASRDEVKRVLDTVFKNWNRELVFDGLRAAFGPEAVSTPTAAQVHAVQVIGDTLPATTFVAAWHRLVGVEEPSS